MRKFNVTGLCNPNKHYMVDITNKLEQIETMIAEGNYFTINRGRQYGKTTTLRRLRRFLADRYIVISLSFERWSDSNFSTEENFCEKLLTDISKALKQTDVSEDYRQSWLNADVKSFDKLSDHFEEMCEGKKVVLLIDEVDRTSHNRTFLKFLGILRDAYLDREDEVVETFQSVILAGVYNIKNIKLKMINDGIYMPLESENNLRNSPWNIAANFKVDMSFNPNEIASMLTSYEDDAQTDMDIDAISEEIYNYTSGYPFMVSRLCQIIHEDLDKNWTVYGVRLAVSLFVREDNQLFSDMAKNLENDKQLYNLMYDVLILGFRKSFSYDSPTTDMAYRYGYIKFDERYTVSVFNKVFETRISYYFVSKNELSKPLQKTSAVYHKIVVGDTFDMALCLEKFAEFYDREIYPTKEKKFLEEHYRISFLSYLKPLLNGIGHYHQESKLIDDTRMDLVVNYLKQEFIIELKRIFTESDRTEGLEQLLDYMKSRGADVGYYLTFDFRKKSVPRVEWLEFDGKRILEISV